MTSVALSPHPSALQKSDWPDFCCPIHGDYLEIRGDALCCPEGEKFLLRENIPRFVGQESYADAFGAQWKKYRLTQLDSFSGVPAPNYPRCPQVS